MTDQHHDFGATPHDETHVEPPTGSDDPKGAPDFRRMASDAVYAAAGFAGFVGEKAKEFYDEQIKQYAQAHPETSADDPGAKAFLKQLGEKVNALVDDMTRIFKDMVDRGRATHGRQHPTDAPGAQPAAEEPAPAAGFEDAPVNPVPEPHYDE